VSQTRQQPAPRVSKARRFGFGWRRRDVFGLRPVRRGWVRGQVRNLQELKVTDTFGERTVYCFELLVAEHEPPVPVRMPGNSFSASVFNGALVDIRDPDPSQRPLVTKLLRFPPHYKYEVRAFYPGFENPTPAQERLTKFGFVMGPILAVLALIGLYFLFFGGAQ
jgi:hypothetical protein